MSSCACNMFHFPPSRDSFRVCVCVFAYVCMRETVFKMKIENQPLLCLALVKVPQLGEQRMLSVAFFFLLFLFQTVVWRSVTMVPNAHHSSEPAERFWVLLRGDLLGEALSERETWAQFCRFELFFSLRLKLNIWYKYRQVLRWTSSGHFTADWY